MKTQLVEPFDMQHVPIWAIPQLKLLLTRTDLQVVAFYPIEETIGTPDAYGWVYVRHNTLGGLSGQLYKRDFAYPIMPRLH